MVSSGKKARGKHRLDKFYHLAKEQGYRSRAAFKLIQLNKKHGFLNDARAVLDLCAAPGGWLQVCAKHMPLSSRIVGVDIVSIRAVRGVRTIVDDITTQRCRERLRKESEGSLFDVVLHDGAPNVGGAFATEMYTQSALVLDACKLACEFLRPQGTFVTKVFRSRDYTALLYAFRQLFSRVDATKPQASRNTSAEIFVVCSGYKAPAKIDPRLLDHRSLFQDVEDTPKPMGPDALLKSIGKKQRHRTGYDAAVSLMHRASPAAAFILCDDPMPTLASHTALILDGTDSVPPASDADKSRVWEPAHVAEFVRKHAATTTEILHLCTDLQVLGRSEFKQLLRWRMKVRGDILKGEASIRKQASVAEEVDGSDMAVDRDAEGNEATAEATESPEQQLLAEMERLRTKMDHERKISRKKRRELKKKAKMRLAASLQTEGIGEELINEDDALFDIKAIRSKAGLHAVGEVDALDEADVENLLEAPDSDDELVSGSDSDADSDEDALRYEDMVDRYMDNAYQAYLERHHARDANRVERNKRKRLSGDGGEDVGEEDLAVLPSTRGASESEGEDSEEGGGLLMELDQAQAGVRSSGEALAQQWFAQDAFADEELFDDSDEEPRAVPHSSHATVAPRAAASARKSAGKAAAPPAVAARHGSAAVKPGAESDNEDDSDSGAAPLSAAERRAAAGTARHTADASELQVVPASTNDDGDSTDTDGEFEAMDDHAKAEIRAMARKWMRSRKNQLGLLDAAYNRYTFNDEGLPRWFKDDEAKHMRPMTGATRDELAAEKELLRAIDARPLKKVAEAKARKRRRVSQKTEQARNKAEGIVDNADMSIQSKAREIGKLYAKAKAAGKDKRAVKKTDSKMSRSAKEKSKRKGPPLDRRMVADKMKGKACAKTKAKGKGRR